MMKAWHFVNESRTLMDGNTVAPGYVYSVEGPVILCRWGLHASVRPIDALKYAPGPVVCRVGMSGQIIEDTDKLVATQREVLWMADATRTLHEFSCWCVRDTPLGDGRVVWDLLSDDHRKAVQRKESWLRGEATDTDLFAARTAAWAAGSAAVWAAVWADDPDAARAAQNDRLTAMITALGGE